MSCGPSCARPRQDGVMTEYEVENVEMKSVEMSLGGDVEVDE